jgi:predicted RNase H-like HicB family nuclease
MPAVKSYNEELLVGIAPGTWVAISADQERVVATGATIEEAIQKAKEAKEKKQPFIIRVPVENSALIL